MAGINERWEAQQRSRWMRPDAARYLRPDIERYFTPAAWQAMTPAQRGQLSGAEIERKGHVVTERSIEDLQRERRWLARQKLELLELYDLHLRLKAQLYSEKYSPNQPRVPKGNSDGGQWTSYGGGSGRGGRVRVADLRSDRGGINDRRVISDADPERPLNGRTASRYKDPNDLLGLNKWRLEGGGGGGRGGLSGSAFFSSLAPASLWRYLSI